jgi:hypothetical protein
MRLTRRHSAFHLSIHPPPRPLSSLHPPARHLHNVGQLLQPLHPPSLHPPLLHPPSWHAEAPVAETTCRSRSSHHRVKETKYLDSRTTKLGSIVHAIKQSAIETRRPNLAQVSSQWTAMACTSGYRRDQVHRLASLAKQHARSTESHTVQSEAADPWPSRDLVHFSERTGPHGEVANLVTHPIV